MRTLNILDVPEDVYRRIEERARSAGKSVSQQAAEFLAKAVAVDPYAGDAEAALLNEIRKDRESYEGGPLNEGDLQRMKRWGRE